MNIIEFPSDYVEKTKEDTSIYQYRRGYNLQYEPTDVTYGREDIFNNIMDCVTTKAYSVVDLEIIKALYRFKWLNKLNIVRYLNYTNVIPRNMKKKNYNSNIKRLRKDGVIVTFSREPIFAGEEEKIIVYRLSEGAYDYANAFCGLKKTYGKEIENMKIDTAKALEILSINQWYLAVLTQVPFSKSWYRNKFKYKKSSIMIDCAFRLDVDKEKYGSKTLMLYAFAMPKKDDGYVALINRLLTLNSYLGSPDNHYKCSLILVTCESMSRIKSAFAAIRHFPELDEIELLFALDSETKDGTGIGKIYACDYSEATKGIKYYTTEISLFSGKKPNGNLPGSIVEEF